MSYGGYCTVSYCRYQTWPFIWLEATNSVEIPMEIAGRNTTSLLFQFASIQTWKSLKQQINIDQHKQRFYQQFYVYPFAEKTIRNQINTYAPADGEIGYCSGFFGYAQANYPWIIAQSNYFLQQQLTIISEGSNVTVQQFTHQKESSKKLLAQFNTEVEQFKTLPQQLEQTNDVVYFSANNIFCQFDISASTAYHMEFRQMSYNLTQLRILWEIASDGNTSLNNYTTSSYAGTGYEVVNLRSDFIERAWRTTACTSEWFQFDAGVGNTIGIDTSAIIGHNLTNNAVITVYGYGDAFSNAPATDADWYALTPEFSMTVQPNYANIYYIATVSAASKYRHWRVLIQDPSNTDGFISVGRFVAGESLVFDTRENMTMDVDYSQTNYKDELKLNGFSSISNNRALRSRLRLGFDNLDMESNDNYAQLQRMLTYCRDTLKALVIPDPRRPYRYTVYSKLSQMPQEKHRFIDDATSYATFDLEFDEAR
jgi:hypothetical protein